MKRRLASRLIAPLLLALLAIPACRSSYDPFDPPDFQPTAAPTDWMSIPQGLHYTPVEPFRPDRVPAKRIDLPRLQDANLLLPLSDGGGLSVSSVPVDEKDVTGNPTYYLRAVRFKPDGGIRWDRTFKDDPFQGYAARMCVFPDDGFAVALMANRAGSSNYDAVALLRRFGPDGAPLWKSKEGDLDAGALDRIVPIEDGALLAIGNVTPELPDGSFGRTDISLLRIEKDGSRTKGILIDTGGYDTLMDADYDPSTGLVVAWRSESEEDRDSQAYPQRSRVTCYDSALERLWQVDLPESHLLYETSIPSGAAGILALGVIPDEEAVVGQSAFLSAVKSYDAAGTLRWTFAMKAQAQWIQSVERLGDGRFVVGWTRQTDDLEQSAVLTLLSASGQEEREIAALPGTTDWIAATKDGGFIACVRQTVRALPQPPYISSMWTDSEAIVVKYDRSLALEWRRTIDQYKQDTRGDVILVTVDDRLLVG